MAENRIKKSDIAEEDVFAYVGQSAEKNLAKIIALDNQLRKTTETLAGLGRGTNTETLAGINQLVLTQKELDVVVKQAIETDKQKLITEKALEKQRLADIKLQQEREKSIDRYNAKLEKERQAEEKLASVYNKVQSKLSGMKKEYRDLAVRKELGAKLTDQEAKRYDFLAGKIQTYDTALKSTDASMGQHFRNVGNYASAWNGLGNSVNQLTREMPAFANSVQTGFMALSNNLPIFFDEIKKINTQNAELKKNGQQTTSVFKQLGSSIFSLSTGLSIGVTLLTVYGAKIFDWVGSLMAGNKEVDNSAKLLKARNEEQQKSAKFIAEESSQFIGNILALKKTNAGSEERKRLIKNINDQYGTTLQNLKDEAKFQAQLNLEVASYLEYAKAKYIIQRNEELITKNLEKQDKLQYNISENEKKRKKIAEDLAKARQNAPSDLNITTKDGLTQVDKTNLKINGLAYELDQLNQSIAQDNAELEQAKQRFENYGTGLLNAQNNIEKLTKGHTKYDIASKKSSKSTKEQIDHLDALKFVLNDLEDDGFGKITGQIEKNTDAMDKARDSYRSYIEKVDPIQAIINQNKDDLAVLEEALKQGIITQEQYDKLREQELKSTKSELDKIGTEADKKEIEDTKKTQKEKRDIIQKYGDEIIDGFIDRSKKRETILNRELDSSKKQEDYLRQLAVNGNADAKQSLAAQENVSKEKQRLADQENRRQQQLEEAKMVYKSILQFMDKGDSLPEATAKGIAGTLGIRKLIASLPGFYKGTKGTIADELGSPMLQGKDGYVVRVDGSEKVLNPELSRMTGTATTDEIVNGYLMARNMQNVLVPVSSGVTSQNEYDMLTKELRDLKHTIKNKRELHFSEDVKMGIARGLIVTEKQGLTRTRTTYRP